MFKNLVINMLMLKPNCKMRKILLHSWNHQPPTIASIKMFQEVTIDPHRHSEITFLPKVLTKNPWCVLGVQRQEIMNSTGPPPCLGKHHIARSSASYRNMWFLMQTSGPEHLKQRKDVGTAGNDFFSSMRKLASKISA